MQQRDRMRQDFVTDREPGDGGSNASDDAGGLHAQRHWWADANVPASASHNVVPVADTGSVYLDEHLPGLRNYRIRELHKLDRAVVFSNS